ncbi:glycosyltransferase family 2 protein [Devosia lacusdianchii]|uniref:glycosyltransferase family 2 protein n=1 Tax=Devosia lacusdianchii TaxID=2917991 RepID=UPI001F05E355|nr:glycosyltransferase family 2 protein [Devosia sp. JXJ CY 41]
MLTGKDVLGELGIKISVVVPIYNDGRLAPAFCAEIQRVFGGYLNSDQIGHLVEIIFVNDGSENDSISVLTELTRQYAFVRVVDMSRNFGQHIAIACGLREASGSIVFRMNVDMQDQPADMPRFIEAMRKDASDLVIGVYSVRESPWINRITSKIYYWLFQFLTGLPSPQNTSPLRAMSRRFVDAYNLLTERSRFPQGLDQWLGFEQQYIPIQHHVRADGKSSYNFWSRLKLGLEGLLYFSNRPLTLIASLGFFLSVAGLLLGFYVIFAQLFGSDFLPGFAALSAIGLIAFGVQLGSIGVVGLYVARIFAETQNRPLYLVKMRYGASPDTSEK